jgi:DinB family protein
MNAVSLLRIQLEGSFARIAEAANETSDDEWIAQASDGQNPAGFTLWHCVRSIDWAVNCAIRGIPEVANQARWQGMLATTAWYGYEVTMDTARHVAASVARAELMDYAGDVQNSVIPWLESLSDEELDGVPDIARNYSSNGMYESSPMREAWIKEDAGTPVWQLVTGTCVGHVRTHMGEVQALRQVLRSRLTT